MVGAPITLVSAFLMFVVPQPSSLAAVSGYQNLSNGATLGTTNENCRSLVVGANTPKVIKTLLPGSQQYPGGTLHYQVTLNPAAVSTYNIRDCLVVEDAAGNVLSTLDEAQFSNVDRVAPSPSTTSCPRVLRTSLLPTSCATW